MNHVIYFGKVPEEYKDWSEYYEHNGDYFYFQATITEDGLTITDTCNRIMPFDYTNLRDLMNLSAFAHSMFKHLNDLEKDYDDTYKDIIRTLSERYGLTE